MQRKICLITALAGWMMFMTVSAWSDVLIFRNGDYRYGQLTLTPEGYDLLESDGVTRSYTRTQVYNFAFGVNEPKTAGQVVTVTDFIQAATDTVWDITGATTIRNKITTDDHELLVDVEEGFEIPRMQLSPTRYPFYNRQGSVLTASFANTTDTPVLGTDFRIYFYDAADNLLISKDFYVTKLNPALANFKLARVFTVTIPDIHWRDIRRIRVVRKY